MNHVRYAQGEPRTNERVEDAFTEGLSQAYYEVISVMQNQAEAFGIPLADLALEGRDVDRDLI